MLCIGRFVPEKRLIEVMDTVNELRLAGHEMQLHIAGSADQSKYRRRLVAAAARHHWVNLHEGLSRTALDELASHCRYGIHAMQGEHFGMAVAQMQQAGCLVFVPRHGGCAKIIADDALMYESSSEAVAN